jgi:chromosome partitioning protein
VSDFETLDAVRDVLLLAKNPLAFVLFNGMHPAARKSAEEAKTITANFGLTACPVHLCRRSSYAEAPAPGQAPQELEPGGKAASELQRLYMFISQHINMTRGQHGEKRSRPAASARAETPARRTPARSRGAGKLQGSKP